MQWANLANLEILYEGSFGPDTKSGISKTKIADPTQISIPGANDTDSCTYRTNGSYNKYNNFKRTRINHHLNHFDFFKVDLQWITIILIEWILDDFRGFREFYYNYFILCSETSLKIFKISGDVDWFLSNPRPYHQAQIWKQWFLTQLQISDCTDPILTRRMAVVDLGRVLWVVELVGRLADHFFRFVANQVENSAKKQ